MSGKKLVVWFVIVAGGLGLVGVVSRWALAPTVADLRETAAKLEVPAGWVEVDRTEHKGFREWTACFASSCPSIRIVYVADVTLADAPDGVAAALAGTDEVEVPAACPAPGAGDDDTVGATLCSGFGRLDGRPIDVDVGTVASARDRLGAGAGREIVVTVGP